jgi:hypothetical protein
MLGVLAIMGVITVMGIAGYQAAVRRLNDNEIVQQSMAIMQELSMVGRPSTQEALDSLVKSTGLSMTDHYGNEIYVGLNAANFYIMFGPYDRRTCISLAGKMISTSRTTGLTTGKACVSQDYKGCDEFHAVDDPPSLCADGDRNYVYVNGNFNS